MMHDDKKLFILFFRQLLCNKKDAFRRDCDYNFFYLVLNRDIFKVNIHNHFNL